MDPRKRNFLLFTIPAVLAARFGFYLAPGLAQSPRPVPQNPTSPAPAPNPMPPTPNSNEELKLDSKQMLKKNQGQIHDDVEKIYALAGELKGEVEKTDSADVLSLPMIQKAEQIEKLAKQVKNLARGQ